MQYDKAIKIIRSVYGLSQREFALRTGITQSVVSRVESRERIPTEDFIQKVLEEFDIPIELFNFLASPSKVNWKEQDKDTLAKMLLELLTLSNQYE